MKRFIFSAAVCLLGSTLSAQSQTPQATELPGTPFTVKNTWTIGGEGNWDYLTLDPSALRLYIAHGPVVQVVDVTAGTLIGEVKGLRDAHEIALDDSGKYGFVTDGPLNEVAVFDRGTLEVVAHIPTARNPRSLVFDPESKLLFVVCPDSAPQERKIPRRSNGSTAPRRAFDSLTKSRITIIDADKLNALADVTLSGKLGFAARGEGGAVYVNITDRDQIAVLHAGSLEPLLHNIPATPGEDQPAEPNTAIDWSDNATGKPPIPRQFHTLALSQDCTQPRALAVDERNRRLFVACDSMKLQVLDAHSGSVVASLPISQGTDAVGYDPERGMIYVSNGAGVGSVTIIKQHLTDSYAVVQELPTQARARTLAVNPTNGEVYLVTNILGLDRANNGGSGGNNGNGSVGNLKESAVPGSFRVLVVGN